MYDISETENKFLCYVLCLMTVENNVEALLHVTCKTPAPPPPSSHSRVLPVPAPFLEKKKYNLYVFLIFFVPSPPLHHGVPFSCARGGDTKVSQKFPLSASPFGRGGGPSKNRKAEYSSKIVCHPFVSPIG